MTILVGSDLHNDEGALEWFCTLAEQHRPDMIAFLGDFVTGGPVSYVREVALTLRPLAEYVLAVPGNHDPRESLVELDIVSIDGFKNLHKQAAWINGFSFAGLGGSIHTPKHAGEFEFDDEGYADGLVACLPADIWVLHNPLKGFLDVMPSGVSLGSESLLKAYREQSLPPQLVLSGHVHAQAGSQRFGPTLFLNPGSLAEGSAALVSLAGTTVMPQMLQRTADNAVN